MSALDCNPTLWSCEDVLLLIFQHLDGKDLVHCEAVCRQWRQVMLTGTPWIRWLKQRSASPELRPFWHRMGLDETNLQFQDYRAICRDIVRYLNQQDNNWRHGKYEESSLECNADYATISGNYTYCPKKKWDPYGTTAVTILDKTSQVRAINRIDVEGELLQFYNNIVIYKCRDKIKFADYSDGHVISELTVGWSIRNYRFNGKLLAVRFDDHLCVWKVENDNMTMLKRLEIISDFSLEMDGKYIVVVDRFFDGEEVYAEVNFICTKAMEIKRTLNVGLNEFAYVKGLLFILTKKNVVRIWNVASEIYLDDLHIPHGYAPCIDSRGKIKANSKFLIMLFDDHICYDNKLLCIYDLEAIKNGSCSAKGLPLHTIRVSHSVREVSADETHIVVSDTSCYALEKKIITLDFRPVDCQWIDPLPTADLVANVPVHS